MALKFRHFYTLVILVGLVFSPGRDSARADLYIWVDENGVRHVSNVAPPRGGAVTQIKEAERFAPEGRVFRVVRVFDGDTIRVTGMGLTFKVRLVGIDAPEAGWKGNPGQPYGREAAEALSGMILNRDIVLKQHGTGGYNRILAEVFLNRENINIRMLRKGMAEVYRGKMASGIKDGQYRSAEAAARRSRVGIWSQGSAYKSPRQWRRKNSAN